MCRREIREEAKKINIDNLSQSEQIKQDYAADQVMNEKDREGCEERCQLTGKLNQERHTSPSFFAFESQSGHSYERES